MIIQWVTRALGLGKRDSDLCHWKHPDWVKRREAVFRIYDQAVLGEIARTDPERGVREAAIEKLQNQDILAEVARTDSSKYARMSAIKRIEDLVLIADIAKSDPDAEIREVAASRLGRDRHVSDTADKEETPALSSDGQKTEEEMRQIIWSAVSPFQTMAQDGNNILSLGPACVPIVIDIFLHPKKAYCGEPSSGTACNQAILEYVLEMFAVKGNQDAATFLRSIANGEVDLFDFDGQNAYESAKAFISMQDSCGAIVQPAPQQVPDHKATSASSKDFTYATNHDGITIIGYVGWCGELVAIPDTIDGVPVTAIGASVFSSGHGHRIRRVAIPASVARIGEKTFDTHILSIEVDASSPFYTSVHGVLFTKGQTTLVKYAGGKDSDNYSIPDGVTSIGRYAFSSCLRLNDITIPNSVTAIGDAAFAECQGLTSIKIPETVVSIGDDAFHNCDNLASVTLPKSVISIGKGAFWNCGRLADITIPASVRSIGDHAFSFCNELGSVAIPANVNKIGNGPFASCLRLREITVDPLNCDYSSTDGVLFSKDHTTLIQYPAGKGDYGSMYAVPSGVRTIGNRAFYGCLRLDSITIPTNVAAIGDQAFADCKGLTSITLPNSVTSIGDGAFTNCRSLTDVWLPDSVTTISGGLFFGCTHLTAIRIPAGVTTIGGSAFSGCTNLTSVTMPNSLTSIGDYAFASCEKLTSVTIGNRVTSIGAKAFAYCTNLASVTIPEGVTSIGVRAFDPSVRVIRGELTGM